MINKDLTAWEKWSLAGRTWRKSNVGPSNVAATVYADTVSQFPGSLMHQTAERAFNEGANKKGGNDE